MKTASPTTQPAQSPDAKAGHTAPNQWHNVLVWAVEIESQASPHQDRTRTNARLIKRTAEIEMQREAAAPAYYAAAEQVLAAWKHYDLEHAVFDDPVLDRAIAALAAAHAAAKP